jgi:hypothetical protein
MSNERVWTLHLNHSDLIEIYNTTSDAIIKRKIENHFLADKMSHWKNWSKTQWDAVRKYFDAHGDYPKDSWWDEEKGDWAFLGADGEIQGPAYFYICN